MRPNTAALIRSYPCKCGESHTAKVMVHGIPLMECPKLKGDTLHAVFTKTGDIYLLVGK